MRSRKTLHGKYGKATLGAIRAALPGRPHILGLKLERLRCGLDFAPVFDDEQTLRREMIHETSRVLIKILKIEFDAVKTLPIR